MEEIKGIVQKIIKGCAQAGTPNVSEVLAAFIARTVVEKNETKFLLDKKMTPARINELVLLSVEKLVEKDSPAVETVKMQVDYDDAFLRDDNNVQKGLKMRNKMVITHKTGITDVEMVDANDFETLTGLYRKIFRFLLEFSPSLAQILGTKVLQDRAMEREVAAALESVFPRVGLKTFAQLSREDKSVQLLELARIVLGIRLFNKDQSRGGAGIDNMDGEGLQLSIALASDIDREVDNFSDTCNKYLKAIIRAHLQKRRQALAEEKSEAERYAQTQAKYSEDLQSHTDGAAANSKNSQKDNVLRDLELANNINPNHIPINNKLIDRWSQELGNRRQYLSFLRTLQEEVNGLRAKINQLCVNMRLELDNLKTLVNNKSSVPKEIVYPRFDALGTLYTQLYEEVLVLYARKDTFNVLCKYRLSFSPTLLESFYADSDEQTNSQWNSVVKATTEEITNTSTADAKTVGGGGAPSKDGKDVADSHVSEDRDAKAESKDIATSAAAAATASDDTGAKGAKDQGSSAAAPKTGSNAVLLSAANTPDFISLPLQFQGFCPWTIVHARGLLIPGKPGLGVVRYDNMYYVCDHAPGVEAFMADPDYYLQQIKEKAIKNAEYIHLLQIQKWFPKASISKLLEQQANDDTAQMQMAMSSVPGRGTRDVGTGTPVHFIDKHIDVNYHWNEWELRKRALSVANLQNCLTKGIQTDRSHFKVENETQVYLLRDKSSQTKKDQGTNPPIVTTYIAGLRGATNNTTDSCFDPKAPADRIINNDTGTSTVSSYIDNKDKSKGTGIIVNDRRPRVVTLKLDL